MGFHRGIVPTADPNAGPHVVHQFQFVDAGAMSAGTDSLKGAVTLTAADVGMVCRVGAAAPYDFYVLTNHVGPVWEQINGGGGGGGGDVTGPGSSNDNAIARYDGTTGKTIQNSGATIDDAGVITAAGLVTAGTVDGRDVSADGAALDAHIAAANPHSGSLGTAHEGAGGPVHANAVASGAAGFMTGADKAKLDGVEAGADVTDATNVAAAGAVMDADYAGSYAGDQIRTGAAAYAVVRHNRSAAAAPTVNDDSTQNYEVGSRWFDTTADRAYTCLDASVGAAVWREVSVVAAAVAAAGAVMDSDFGGSYSADLTRTGAGTYAGLRNNLAATASPSATDDSASNYAVGSRWIDTTADRAWTCVDATPGAAVWIEGGGGGGGGPTIESYSNFASGATVADQDFYLGSSDLLNVPTFTLTALVRIFGDSGIQHVAGSSSEFNESFWLGINGDEIRFQAVDSTGAAFIAAWFASVSYGGWLLLSGSKITQGAAWSRRLFINGAEVSTGYEISGGGARATNNFAIGAACTGADHAAERTRIAWVSLAYRALAQDEQKEWWESIIENDGAYLSPPSGAEDHQWNLSGTPGATLTDTVGAANLTRTGSATTLTGTTRKFLT